MKKKYLEFFKLSLNLEDEENLVENNKKELENENETEFRSKKKKRSLVDEELLLKFREENLRKNEKEQGK